MIVALMPSASASVLTTMDVSDLILWIARLGVLVLMYLFLLALILALRADARAAAQPRPPAPPTPQPGAMPAAPARPAMPSSAPTRVRAMTVMGGTAPTTGSEYQLYGPLEIGRGSACTISIPNHFVSTRHARIYALDGTWMIEDLGSTNGTLVNGQPLHAPHPLAPGDCVVVGDTEFAIK